MQGSVSNATPTDWAAWITAAATVVTALGVAIGMQQVRVSARASRAQMLLHFNDKWRDPDLYESVRYIHNLRREWMTRGGRLSDLAAEWVETNRPSVEASRPSDARPNKAWFHRREAAQYLRHVGYLLRHGYLSADDVFSTFPEARRVLEVLLPLENAIIDAFPDPSNPTGLWDRTAKKWELEDLARRYEIWFKRKGHHNFGKHTTHLTESYPMLNAGGLVERSRDETPSRQAPDGC